MTSARTFENEFKVVRLQLSTPLQRNDVSIVHEIRDVICGLCPNGCALMSFGRYHIFHTFKKSEISTSIGSMASAGSSILSVLPYLDLGGGGGSFRAFLRREGPQIPTGLSRKAGEKAANGVRVCKAFHETCLAGLLLELEPRRLTHLCQALIALPNRHQVCTG